MLKYYFLCIFFLKRFKQRLYENQTIGGGFGGVWCEDERAPSGSVRVVKESDSKSDGLCPHRFESCGPRSFGTNWLFEKKSMTFYVNIKSECIPRNEEKSFGGKSKVSLCSPIYKSY